MSSKNTKGKNSVGRPPLFEEGKTVSVRLTVNMVDLIDEDAEPEYRSRAAQIRKVLDAHYYETK